MMKRFMVKDKGLKAEKKVMARFSGVYDTHHNLSYTVNYLFEDNRITRITTYNPQPTTYSF